MLGKAGGLDLAANVTEKKTDDYIARGNLYNSLFPSSEQLFLDVKQLFNWPLPSFPHILNKIQDQWPIDNRHVC